MLGLAIFGNEQMPNATESLVWTETIQDEGLYLKAVNAIPTPKILVETTNTRASVNPYCPIAEQCVYYVTQKTGIQIKGNAIDWPGNAESFGYGFYKEPRIGGAVAIATKNKFGHIAIVESFAPNAIVISEQNFRACGVITWRTIELNDPQILGYIY